MSRRSNQVWTKGTIARRRGGTAAGRRQRSRNYSGTISDRRSTLCVRPAVSAPTEHPGKLLQGTGKEVGVVSLRTEFQNLRTQQERLHEVFSDLRRLHDDHPAQGDKVLLLDSFGDAVEDLLGWL